MTISIKREDLLKRLNEQLAEAQKEDARAKAKHEKEEQAALMKFRARLREALKWDYKRVKAIRCYGEDSLELKAPSCPTSKVTHFQSLIRQVGFDTRKVAFRVDSESELGRALNWLPESKRPPQTICD